MKPALRIGCWTVAALIIVLGTLVVLFLPARQERSDVTSRTIKGNVALLGGDVKIEKDERVRGNLLIVGNDLTLEGQIGGNLIVIGGDAVLAAASRVGGNVSVIGGDADMTATSRIGGNVSVIGGDADMTATSRVGGNVRVIGGQVTKEPTAQIDGSARGRINTNRVAHGHVVTADESEIQIQRLSHRTPWFILFLQRLGRAFLWTLLITGLVLLLVWLQPKQVERITRTAETEPGLSFVTGAIVVIGSVLLATILTITICFALLALPLLALLALVMLFGWAATSCWLGRRLDDLLAGQANISCHPLVFVAVCSLFITGITTFSWAIVPCLGFIVALLIGSTGSGAVLVHLARHSRHRPDDDAPPAAPDAPGPTEGLAPSAAESTVPHTEEIFDTDAELSLPSTEEEQLADETLAPDEQDDLTRLRGVGPTLAQRLQNAGITTFAQLAALEVEQIAEAIGWSAFWVERERLREQAAELAAKE